MTKWILAVFITCCFSFWSHGQINLSGKDSLEIKLISEEFYEWYGHMTITRELENFNPQFVKSSDGRTTLDFSTYRKQLKKHRFTKDLIENRIGNFQECLDNLKSIPYDTFLQYQDLDQFEEIGCDFANRYEFVGGMEWIYGADLKSIKALDKHKVQSTLTLYSVLGDKKIVHGHKEIILIKDKRNWKISDI